LFCCPFNAARIASVFGQMVEIVQVPTGAVSPKAQDLFEYRKDRQPFFTLSVGFEKSVNQRKNIDTVQVGHKQRQSGSVGQPIAYFLNRTDLQFLFSIFFATFCQ